MGTTSDPPSRPESLTALLQRTGAGDARAKESLWRLVYQEVRAAAAHALAREPRRPDVLQTTALANEVYLRLNGGQGAAWENRRHFWGAVSRAMRRVLAEQARSRRVRERRARVSDVAACEMDSSFADGVDLEALCRALDELGNHSRHRRKAEVVELRFFAGRSVAETAAILDVSEPTVKREWRFARAWLRRRLELGETP